MKNALLFMVLSMSSQSFSQMNNDFITSYLGKTGFPSNECSDTCISKCAEVNDRVRIFHSYIKETPSANAKNMDVLGEEFTVKYGVILDAISYNGYYNIEYTNDITQQKINGWVCGCDIELKCIPYFISENKDSSFYKSIMIDAYKKSECDGLSYDRTVAAMMQILGKIYFDNKKYIRAIKYFTASNNAWRNQYSIAKRGIAKYFASDYHGCIIDLESIHLDYNDIILDTLNNQFKETSDLEISYVRLIKATSYFALRQFDEAMIDINKSISLNNYNPRAYYLRGLIKYRTGDKTSGCRDFSIAGQQGYDGAYESIKKYCNE